MHVVHTYDKYKELKAFFFFSINMLHLNQSEELFSVFLDCTKYYTSCVYESFSMSILLVE